MVQCFEVITWFRKSRGVLLPLALISAGNQSFACIGMFIFSFAKCRCHRIFHISSHSISTESPISTLSFTITWKLTHCTCIPSSALPICTCSHSLQLSCLACSTSQRHWPVFTFSHLSSSSFSGLPQSSSTVRFHAFSVHLLHLQYNSVTKVWPNYQTVILTRSSLLLLSATW